LAEWNGLGADLSVREGQYLLIPTSVAAKEVATSRLAAAAPAAPGVGSATPVPPSAAKPLPRNETPATAAAKPAQSVAPDLGKTQTITGGKLAMPLDGTIIREYVKGKSDGIDIKGAAGAVVRAADAGTVAAITQDADQTPIIVIRHADNLLTVYANVDNITVRKGANVARGQGIAKLRSGDASFLHFEVRKGFDSVDPMPYLR
jgi:murein DD-endopeptidase MepM/ murein hydrolase activator NlpD